MQILSPKSSGSDRFAVKLFVGRQLLGAACPNEKVEYLHVSKPQGMYTSGYDMSMENSK